MSGGRIRVVAPAGAPAPRRTSRPATRVIERSAHVYTPRHTVDTDASGRLRMGWGRAVADEGRKLPTRDGSAALLDDWEFTRVNRQSVGLPAKRAPAPRPRHTLNLVAPRAVGFLRVLANGQITCPTPASDRTVLHGARAYGERAVVPHGEAGCLPWEPALHLPGGSRTGRAGPQKAAPSIPSQVPCHAKYTCATLCVLPRPVARQRGRNSSTRGKRRS